MTTQQQLAEDIFSFFADPKSYVLYAFPWGVKGTPLEDFPHGPDEWQMQEFEAMAMHIRDNINKKAQAQEMIPFLLAIASGHGIGKSAFVAWLILWLMSTRRYVRGVVTANTQIQLEGKTWAELAKWHNMAINKEWFRWTATKFYCLLEPEGEKNWMFECVPWNEERTEAFAGLHNASSSAVMIFDEASAVPDKIWEVAEGAMTDGEPFWFTFGNPTRNTGRFRECFGKYRHRWRHRHIDSRSVRITNKTQINKLVEDHGVDSDLVKVRVRGMFPSAGDKQFINSDVVEEAQTRECIEDRGAALIMGVDVSRGGTAMNVIRFRKGRDGRSIPPIRWSSRDTTYTVNRVAEAIDRYNPDAVNMDGGGIGGPMIDQLRQKKYKINEVQFGASKNIDNKRFANWRAQMWQQMKEWLVFGCIDDDNTLRDDLIGPEYSFTNKDQLLLEGKEHMEARGQASPDDGDALALTFATNIGRRDMNSGGSRRSTGRMAEGVDAPFI